MFRSSGSLAVKFLFVFSLIFIPVWFSFFLFTREFIKKQIYEYMNQSVDAVLKVSEKQVEDRFLNLEQLGERSADFMGDLIQQEISPEQKDLFEVKYKIIKGALRTDVAAFGREDISAVVLFNHQPLNDQIKHLILSTEKGFDEYAKALKGLVFSTYYISPYQMSRVYPKTWNLEVEPDHNFTKDEFYYIGDPRHAPDRKPRWTKVYYDSFFKHWMTSVITPLYLGNQFMGVVGHDVILDKIYQEVMRERHFGVGYGFIFDGDRNIVVHPNYTGLLQRHGEMNQPLKTSFLGNKSLESAVEKLVQSRGKGPVLFREGGQEKYIYATRLHFLNWYFGIVVPKKYFFECERSWQQNSSIIGVVFLLTIFLIVYFVLLRNVICPLNSILNGIREIGKGNLDYRVRYKSGSELGVLTNSFNEMAENLKKITASRDDLNQQIIERIEAQNTLQKVNRELVNNERALKNMLFDLQKTHQELKNTQSQLIHSEKMASLGQLSAGIAHEINNPVGFISSNIGTLEEYIKSFLDVLKVVDDLNLAARNGDPGEISKMTAELARVKERVNFNFIVTDVGNLIHESKSGIDRIKKIVRDLKIFARKDEDESKLHSINEIIEGVLNIVWNEIKYKGVLKKEYGGIPQVMCNAQQMGQVFINILVNAAQAISSEGVISIKTWTENGFVCAGFSDTGCGIPEENLNKIFDPFFTTKEVGQGTGLGLSVSYDIVDKHGGKIDVSSKVGTGTTFIVRLPVVNSEIER